MQVLKGAREVAASAACDWVASASLRTREVLSTALVELLKHSVSALVVLQEFLIELLVLVEEVREAEVVVEQVAEFVSLAVTRAQCARA